MFNKKQKLKIKIEFPDVTGIFYYPRNLPLPRIEDFIQIDNACGTVVSVDHITKGTETEIRITCHQYNKPI